MSVPAELPELGPSLAHVAAPPAARPGAVPADDVRLALATRIFEAGAAARAALARGDRAAAAKALDRDLWTGAWSDALATVTGRVAARVDAELAAAAEEARVPSRRRAALVVDAEERQLMAARLGGGAVGFLLAVEALDDVTPGFARGDAPPDAWREAVLLAARRLDGAWLALEAATAEELARWRPEIERVRAWRRPRGPLWAITAAVAALLLYVGLVLGGHLPVPGWLRWLTDWWWSRP